MEVENQRLQTIQSEKGTTVLATCFNGLNALIGVGILSIPYALSQGGWLSLIFLLMVAALCCYTGFLLQKCMVDPQIKTYPDIGQLAFGRAGKTIVSIFMYLELYFVAVEFLILEGDNMNKLFPNANLDVGGQTIGGKHAFVLLTALIVLLTTWVKSLDLLAYISATGVLASIVLVGFVLWIGTFGGVGFHERGMLWQWSGLPTATSLYTFSYCGHAVFPTLCNSMRDRREFSKVILICFILSTFVYVSTAVLGYVMYGGHLLSQVTLNFPTKSISAKIATYITLMSPVTKYALVVSPISMAIEETLSICDSRVTSFIIRTLLVISTLVIALAIPFFGYVMTFTGALFCASGSMILPCLCYLKINRASRKFGLELIIIVIILIFGFLITATGTYVSVRDIVRQLHIK